MRKILSWLDNNFVAVLAGFLLVFIPLYPKWPLFDILYGYNVRVRIEDFVVAFSCIFFFIQVIRKKIPLTVNPVTVTFVIYFCIGFLSIISSIFLIKTVPLEYLHAGKTILHWLRRLEYFSLFLILFASVKSLRTVKVYTFLLFLTLFLVTLYGFGQKYLYFPAFSTMNREYSKGWWLYLTEHARVLSTFGGHYDLAAYLVITLTLCSSFLFGLSNKLAKLAAGILLSGGFWLLILTASRASFIAYLLGLTVVVFLHSMKKGIGWGVSRWLLVMFFSVFLMFSFGDLSDRFLHLFRWSDRISSLRQIALLPKVTPPQNKATFLENNTAAVTAKSDQPPQPTKPADVVRTDNTYLIPVQTATGSSVLVPQERTYSANAVKYDLSTGIRLDATWPQAITGLKRNFLLGSGYATLSKTYTYELTEGESTDNDYLRALGETGILGFITFFGVVVLVGITAYKLIWGVTSPLIFSLGAGLVGIVAGLLANAVLIDVFEASKVAYVFWAIAGLTLGALAKNQVPGNYKLPEYRKLFSDFVKGIKKLFFSDRLWVVLLVILAFCLRLYKIDSPIADWHSWRQADTSAVTRNFIRNREINFLYPTYDDISSIQTGKPNPLGLRFVEFPIYNAISAIASQILPELSVEAAGRLVTAVASSISVAFLFLICRFLFSRRIAYFSALTFAILPYSIYYGRVILPDPPMVTAALGAVWFATLFAKTEKKRFFIISLVLSATALLIKPFAVFLLTPIIYIWFVNFGLNRKIVILSTFYFLLSTFPLGLWRLWISNYPEGIPASSWLFNGDGIRFKGAFWYWIFGDRIARLILGFWGIVLLGFGLICKVNGKYRLFPLVYLLSAICYLLVFATGNVRHDYYQILIIPAISILVGLGFDSLFFTKNQLTNNYITKFLAVVAFVFMIAFSWYFVKDYYNINHPEIMEAGHRVRELTDWRSKVIAPYDGDTAFLYQTDRKGWPQVERSIDYLISQGAQYYVSVRFDGQTKEVLASAETKEDRIKFPLRPRKPFTILDQTNKYVIVQLQ